MADLDAATGDAALDDAAIDAARFLGIPAELVDRETPFALRLRQGLAGLERHSVRGLIGAGRHDVGCGMEEIGAGPALRLAPGLEAFFGGCNRFFDIGHGRRGRTADCLAGGGIGNLKGIGGFRPPLASNEQAEFFVHGEMFPGSAHRNIDAQHELLF
jgi:hypothetical protein